VPDDFAEWHIGHAGHRRENNGRFDPDGTDVDGFDALHLAA
jgi:hypothetical protein